MDVALISAGCGEETLTREAAHALREAELVVGAPRLLEEYAPDRRTAEAVTAEKIAEVIDAASCEKACVLFSGDAGFYSGARRVLPLLKNHAVRVLPGVSSAAYFAARLERPWQDWNLCSAHGVECDPVAAVCGGRPAFFLTGGSVTPGTLCAELAAAGLGTLRVAAGEELGGLSERVRLGTAAEFAKETFSPLSVLLAEAAPRHPRRTPGLPDELFVRQEGIPMTKRELRAAALSRLAVTPEDFCWDIGAGTGSVAVELALQCRAVWGVERSADALALAEKNRAALGAWNLRLVEGAAPEALAALPAPDAVFVGGSGGALGEILHAVRRANPKARICVSAVTLETLHTACAVLEDLGAAVDVTQIAVSRSAAVGGSRMLRGQNPVFLITGDCP